MVSLTALAARAGTPLRTSSAPQARERSRQPLAVRVGAAAATADGRDATGLSSLRAFKPSAGDMEQLMQEWKRCARGTRGACTSHMPPGRREPGGACRKASPRSPASTPCTPQPCVQPRLCWRVGQRARPVPGGQAWRVHDHNKPQTGAWGGAPSHGAACECAGCHLAPLQMQARQGCRAHRQRRAAPVTCRSWARASRCTMRQSRQSSRGSTCSWVREPRPWQGAEFMLRRGPHLSAPLCRMRRHPARACPARDWRPSPGTPPQPPCQAGTARPPPP